MQSFLNQIARFALEKHSNNLGDLTIVLPNRRAIVFLRDEFRKEMNSGGWLPRFFSLEDFILELGDYQQLDPTDLMFELYQVHKEIEGETAEPFQEFLGWGTTLLQDFNEIDRYLVNGKELFSFLTEAKALEIWDVENGALTEFQHKYLKFWTKLGDYYLLFKKKLLSKKQAYQGLGFRSVAESLGSNERWKKDYSDLIFAGFNALTEAEKQIIEFFQLEFGSDVLWDADEYYLNDNVQEAGTFLRGHKKSLKSKFTWVSSNLITDKKEIKIYGVAGNIGQAKLIGNLIISNKKQETAIVLADEELLIPVLESLPKDVDATNVTMGYPISASPLFNWVEAFMDLFQKNEQEGKITSYYHKDLKLVFEHTISQYFSKPIKEEMSRCLSQIEKDQNIFISSSQLITLDEILGQQFFNDERVSPLKLVNNVLKILQLFCENQTLTFDQLTQECLVELEKTFNRLKRLCEKEKDLVEIESLTEIFKQVVSQQSISFIGEPLGGLQIMGVLESRTLDFENIIISSVNEGTLPSGKSHNSFIPFDIKKKFKLPSYQEKDAIFAYHFYRLLQRAQNISILYNTKVDQLQGGERSRFIEQLIHEFKLKNKSSSLTEITVAPKANSNHTPSVSIVPNDRIKKQFINKLENRLSASALNVYLNCPLDFYYKYALRLKETDSFEEKIQDNTLGTLVHDSLEQLYTPYLSKILDLKAIAEMNKLIEDTLSSQFKKLLNTKAESGNHKLTYEVAKQFIKNQITLDKQSLLDKNELIIWKLEEQLEHRFALKVNDQTTINFNLFGKIDRIDSLNGQKRIIDYKTGASSQSDVANKNLSLLSSGNYSKAVQLTFYKYLYEKSQQEEVEVGIISLRNISNGFIPLISKNATEDFEGLLKFAAHKMLSEEEVIQHNPKSEYCKFCKR
ncbi:MAG: PD-(D/E)XK nuclease family protein [Flavobacteriales bacterium]|nr:PD-(D/E)XK nuclease family protein [Flavobacteriales bacterium]